MSRLLRVWVLALGLALLCNRPVLGQGAGEVSAAREIAFEGVKDYEAGRYPEASEKLERAYALVKAPIIGLWSARALAKTGKYVAAAERYLEASRLPLPETNRDNHKRAQVDAANERDALLPKIPKLKITLEGAAAGATVTLDGKAVSSALIGAAQPVDPGKHVVEAKAGAETQKKELTIAEGASETVTLRLEGAGAAAPATGEVKTDSPEPDSGVSAKSSPVLAYVAFGIGGAGLLVGGITGVMAMGKKKKLDDSGHCRDGICDSTVHSDLQSLNTLRTVSTVGFVIGIAGIGTGAVLLLTNKKKKESVPATSLRVGPGHVSFGGQF